MQLQAVGYKLVDPFGKLPVREVGSLQQIEHACKKLVRDVLEENQKRGKKDVFGVCAIHKTLGIHRWFNVAWSFDKDFSVSDYGATEYPGAQGHAESLLSGEWKIATPEEEEACKKKDDDDRLAALAAADKKQAAGSMAAGEAMAKAMTQALANAAKPPEPKGK